MAPQLLFDIADIDLDHVLYDAAAIESVNPHRGAMRMIDAIVMERGDPTQIIAYKDVRDDEFWVPGHIPGRPVFPGVLMIEASAQLSSFVCLRKLKAERFMGFVGVDAVKFRGQVKPGDRLVILCQEIELRPRRSVSLVQGLVRGSLVFEGKITGMPI
jgi:3-hydroxyacyl-[acyl-carrier-protein] dehydratase